MRSIVKADGGWKGVPTIINRQNKQGDFPAYIIEAKNSPTKAVIQLFVVLYLGIRYACS